MRTVLLLLTVSLLLLGPATGQPIYFTLGTDSPRYTTDNMEFRLTDIGQDADGGLPSLTCNTDAPTCCRNNPSIGELGPSGLWRYPDGSLLLNLNGATGVGDGFFFRRNAPQSIRLNRRDGFDPVPLSPTGPYCCTVPTGTAPNTVDMTLCANLVVCLSLPPLINGDITYDNQGVGGVATHSCDPGYTLNGPRFRTCQSIGEWNRAAPTCVDSSTATCADQPVPANGGLVYSDSTDNARAAGSTVTYSCDPGHALSGGDTVRTCTGRTWTGTAPTCVVTGCFSLTPSEIPTNGLVNYNMNPDSDNVRPVGTEASYDCDPMYYFVQNSGTATRTCGNTGVWSGSVPTCIESCTDLSPPANGGVTHVGGVENRRPSGATVVYSCDPGYTLVGTATRTCQTSRSWSGSEPSCQSIGFCPDFTVPTNGDISYDMDPINNARPPDTVATYSCDPGFILTGTLTRTCEITGTWTSGAEPTCHNACSLGHFLAELSSGESLCVPCPANSFNNGGGTICPCFKGYYRTELEGPHFPCSVPPSSCSGLVVVEGRTRANTLTVLWERPQITGRDDFHYNIFHSEDSQTFTRHNDRPYYKGDRLVDYSVSGLRALTNYTIRVSVENGVSHQEGSQDRSCQLTATTGDIRTSAPLVVVGLCTAVTWVAPTSVYGRITGYDIRFTSEGKQSVVSTEGTRELFHIVRNELTGSDNVTVEVRARTVAGDGNWSQSVSLGCSG